MGPNRLEWVRRTLEPQPPTFPFFRELTAGMTGSERLATFLGLPDDLREAMWADLAAHHDGISEELWRLERDDEYPSPPVPTPRPLTSLKDEWRDLVEIPVEVYVAHLSGVELSRGRARCPFPDHDERTPSFQVRGEFRWRCFGCGRDGRIYDFAGCLWGYATPLRDQQFSEVRDRLVEVFGL